MKLFVVFTLLAAAFMLGCVARGESEGVPQYDGSGVSKEALAPSYPPSDASYDSGQYVTKQSYITIKVPEGTLETKFGELKDSLKSEGAEVSDISYNEYSGRKQYTLTVKVLPSKFDSINAMLQQAGEVKDLSVQLEDVTKQYVDLDTKITNREVELQRLHTLYNRSDNISDLLQVEREITRVETELELLKQEKQSLVSRVEKSTISITIYEDKPATQQLTLPLEGLGALFFTAVAAAITLIVVAIGFLLPVAIVIGLIWFAYTKLAGGKKGRPKDPEHKKIPLPE